MSLRVPLLSAAAFAALSAACFFHGTPAKADEAPLVLAQNEEGPGFWERVFNRSEKSPSAKPLFLDRANPAPSGSGTPYDYSSRNQPRTKPFTDEDGLKIMRERDAVAQKRTDEILKLAALENQKRSAALEKSILESNAQAANAAKGGAPSDGKKLVYDPQKTKTPRKNAAPYTARSGASSGQDPEETPSSVPTGRLYNAR